MSIVNKDKSNSSKLGCHKSVKKEILASEYSSEQVLAVNTSTMYVGIRPSKSVIKHALMVVKAEPPELMRT